MFSASRMPPTRSPPDGARARGTLRGLRLTSLLGLALLCGLPVVMATGLLSNAAYDPRLDGNVALQGRPLGPFDVYLFDWPTHPAWLYAVNQGIHVSLGLALIPVVAMKQWSALPRLLALRPRTVAQWIEHVSLLLLVGGTCFELLTGVLFIEYWVPFHFDFTAAHWYGAWVVTGALVIHAGARLPRLRLGLRTRRELAAVGPAAAGELELSRRMVLGSVAAGSALLGLQGVAQDVGGPLRPLAFLLPRHATPGDGPNGFPVNTTFASLGLAPGAIAAWRLTVTGPGGRVRHLSRDELLALPQHSQTLPIACREGWSTTQRWTGVRLRELALAVGIAGPASVRQTALDGAQAALAANQVSADGSLLALDVGGVPLSLDHGYPARVIVPAEIAVNCLKWVDRLEFAPAEPG